MSLIIVFQVFRYFSDITLLNSQYDILLIKSRDDNELLFNLFFDLMLRK